MKIRVRDGRMTVGHHPGEHRSIVIRCAGMEIALTPSEAVTLANRLVDAVEQPTAAPL